MSVKRVFAIIGIVVGCIAAFVGGVIGVMALMGKFKTPVVKPEKLYFENPEQVIVAQYKDDDGKDVIYSFNLKAENNSIDYPVNVKECFIWFEDVVGENLIELCDKDGNLLKPNSKKRYAVNCNETLYFKIKVFYDKYEYNSSTWGDDCLKLFIIQDGKYILNESEEFDSSLIYYTMQTYEEKYSSSDLQGMNNGKVTLRARTVDDTVQTSEDLIIYIDRNVSSIFLKYGDIPATTNNPNLEQRINIGVDKELEFNYVVNPEISMRPISDKSKKVVELYYYDPKSTEPDFVLVNLENIKNKTTYSLYEIFDEEKCYVDELTGDLKLFFRSSKATNGIPHYFKLAIFPSYNAREEFLSDENNLNIKNVDRLKHMITTDLYIQVVNINVDKVTLSDGELNLNLFTNDNIIYLRNEDVEIANLNVEMYAGQDKLDIRFDEIDFKTTNLSMLNINPKFVLGTTQEIDVKEINFAEFDKIAYSKDKNQLLLSNENRALTCYVDSNLRLGDFVVINKLTYEGRDYFCNNGIALVYVGEDTNVNTIKMLEVDSYLDFYVYDSVGQTYALATDDDIKYMFTSNNENDDKNWNIVVENVSNDIINGTKTLVLGLLVANNEGKFNVENLFATKPVSINVQDLHYTIKNSSATLNLLATNDGFVPEDAGKDFDFFINVDEGTYNACVFVISEKEIAEDKASETNKAIVDYVENLFYIDTKGTRDETDDEKFYLVGYFESGRFVNKVRTKNNENVTNETAINKLNVLQLKNIYNETVSETIARLISGIDINTQTVELSEAVQGLYNKNSTNCITVEQKLLVDNNVEFVVLVDGAAEQGENPAGLYSGTSGHTIKITTSINNDVVTRICKFYNIVKGDKSLDDTFILNNYPQNARISGELINTEDEKAVLLTLNVGELLSSDVDVNIKLANVFTIADFEELLYSFKILNSAPNKIVYNYDGGVIELSENQVNAPEVTVVIVWEENKFVEKWFVNYETPLQQEISPILLNSFITGSNEIGFQDPEFKVGQGVSYDITNEAIVKNDEHLDIKCVVNDAVLSVRIAGVTRYLKLDVKQNGFELKQNNIEIASDAGYLEGNGIIAYTYNNDNIYENAYEYINLTGLNVTYVNEQPGELTLDETVSSDTKFVYVYTFVDGTKLTILTVEKDATEKDWKFVRNEDIYSSLSISFKVETKTNTLNCYVKFTSGIEYEYNASAWGEDAKLYQGTTIQLFEVQTIDAGEFKFDTEALIKIRNQSGKLITVEDVNGNKYDESLTLSSTGSYNFVIKAAGEEIAILKFVVLPNIVVKQNSTTSLILDAGSSDVSADIYSNIQLYSYKNSYTYGKDKDEEAGNKIILYSTEFDMLDATTGDPILTEDTNNLKTLVTMSSAEKQSNDVQYVKTNDLKIETAWIDLIGAMQEVNVVVKSGNYEVGTFTAIVKNNNVIKTSLPITDDVLNLKAMLDYAGQFNVEGKTFTLSKIEWAYSDEHNNGTYPNTSSAIPTLNKRFDNINLILTFTGTDTYDGKTLQFKGKNINGQDLTINIIPFEMEDSENIEKAYSENKFNLLKDVVINGETIYGVYNASDLSEFNYIKVLSVKDENGNDLTSSNLGYAYDYTNTTGGLIIEFNKISGDSIKAVITYEVEYVGGLKYVYEKVVTVQNWQELQVKYPENEEDDDSDKYMFVEEITLSNGVKYENIHFEPVFIDVNEGYSINLKDAVNKNVNRITAKNRINGATGFDIESLVVLGYQESVNFPAYVNGYGNIVIDKINGIITFNSFEAQFSGVLALRLTSTSGNFRDYFICVTCLGVESLVSGNATSFASNEYVSGTKISELINDNFIKNTFKINDATSVKMFLLNATVLADNNVDYNKAVFGDTNLDNPIRYTCVNDKTLTISDYTTITLSLIYRDDYNSYVYPIGILTLYLRPNGAVNSQSTGFKDVYSLTNEEGIENGEFKFAIPANTSSVDFPEGFSVLRSENAGDISFDTDSLTITNQVTTAKVFTVFYTKDDYTIKVVYTLNPVDIKAGSTHTIGNLNDEKNKFVDTFIINEDNYKAYFGTYQGKIEIGNATFTVCAGYKFSGALGQTIIDGVGYSIGANGELILTFVQGLYDDAKSINVKYTQLDDSTKQNQTYNFLVKRAVVIETVEGDNQGVNSSQRKLTEKTENYTNSIGSIVSIKREEVGSDLVKYSFAGYTIYIKGAVGQLDFELNTQKDDKTDLSDDNYNLNPSLTFKNSGGELGFVHMPKTKDINVLFTISNDDGEFKTDVTTVDEKILYLTLAQTYSQVEAIYVTKPGLTGFGANSVYYYAESENVIAGSMVENLQENIFRSSINVADNLQNSIKIKLKKIDGSYVESDFSGMGFVAYNNPNFINFSLNVNSKATLTKNIDNTQKIVFDNQISANEKCIVYLDNIAGMPTAEYAFQIMADNKVDGFTFSNEGHHDKTTTATPVEYMSFVIREDNDKDADYTTGKLKIGTIKDGLSKGVYVLKNGSWVFLPKAGSDDAREVPIDHGSNKYYVSLEMDPYNNANWDIYLDYHRLTKANIMPDKTEFKLNIHGTSGYILQDLNIVLFNAEVASKSTSRQSIYGGKKFNILNDTQYGINAPVNAQFELDFEESMVGESNTAIDKKLSSFTLQDGKKSLIDYVDGMLITKTVGKNVDINLVFKVKIDNYYLKDVIYQIQLIRSLQFFFNEDQPVITDKGWAPTSVSSYATNFVLTNYDTSKTPSITTFADPGMKFSFNVSGDKKTVDGVNYFTNLRCELKDCETGQAVDVTIIKDPTKVNVNPDDNTLLVDNTGITFLKDYTGKLYLTLTAGLSNGFNYTVNWTIDVFGILDVQPQTKVDNGALPTTGSYNSGESVDLLGNILGGTTGLYIKDMLNLFDNINYGTIIVDGLNKTLIEDIEYQVGILKYNPYSNESNEVKFKLSTTSRGDEIDDVSAIDRRLTVTLPIVPRTGVEESYLVIYKVTISYLDYSKTYYVAYKVKNVLDISVAAPKNSDNSIFDADNINVSERLVEKNETDTTATYLDLFYYTETYIDADGNDHVIMLTGNNTGNNTYKASKKGASFEEVLINSAGDAKQLKISYDNGATYTLITKQTEEGKTKNYWFEKDENQDIDKTSVFNLNFNNITEFAKFINDIETINIDSESLDIKQYSLQHIKDGRWGINLAEKGNVFNNKLEDAEFIIMAKGSGQPIYSIDVYDPQSRTGFRLSAGNELIASGSQKFSDLFVKETVSSEGWTKYQNIDVVGIYKNGSPATNWVKTVVGNKVPNVDVTTITMLTDVTISVPTGTGSYITYKLQKVKYSIANGGVNGVCSLEDYFYIIKCDTHDAVYRMNLNENSVALYKKGENTIINLDKYFIKFKNDTNGALVIDTNAKVSKMEPKSGDKSIEPTLDVANKTLTASESNLIEFKENNLDKSMAIIVYDVTFDGVSLRCEVRFALPTVAQLPSD